MKKLNRLPSTVSGATKKDDLTPPLGRLAPIKLDTFRHIRDELGRLYREARQGRIATADATRLAYLLGEIHKAVADEDLERRLRGGYLLIAEAEINQPRTTIEPRVSSPYMGLFKIDCIPRYVSLIVYVWA